ncbi:flagellar hook-length control protein FliK [Simiduia agarivorans]|uniref:Flagellar hook-length control protein FliK n=1 Tax=Simiduia agarivorans (strain DSM 21679 / JCM 13881 / BCRC 17597 / SA1) TaxID=1117647 RepID=K4KIB1_SIMAS|nr:flagellar hook-length control protein FliK [Simiduia agarivorans]AFU97693.1 putative flagellar hook-length control protein FliK [Simiduia agarivorans SA1 = DSM 21679]
MQQDLTSVTAGISLFLTMGSKPERGSAPDDGFRSSLRTETDRLNRSAATAPDQKHAQQEVRPKQDDVQRNAAVQQDRVDTSARADSEHESATAVDAREQETSLSDDRPVPVSDTASTEPAVAEDVGSAEGVEAGILLVPVETPMAGGTDTLLPMQSGQPLNPQAGVLAAAAASLAQPIGPTAGMQRITPLADGTLSLIPQTDKVGTTGFAAQQNQTGNLQTQLLASNISADGDADVKTSVDELLVQREVSKTTVPAPMLKTGDLSGQHSQMNPTALLQGLVSGERLLQERFSALGQGRESGAAGPLLKTPSVEGASGLPGSVAVNTAQAGAATARSSLTVPFHQPNWGQGVGEKVVWMVSQKLRFAEIQLDPPELGPLQVKVSVVNDQVSVSFTSQHAPVREALDSQAIRLREILESQGLNLVDVDVSDQQQADQRGQRSYAGDVDGETAQGELAADDQHNTVSYVSPNLVDHFV